MRLLVTYAACVASVEPNQGKTGAAGGPSCVGQQITQNRVPAGRTKTAFENKSALEGRVVSESQLTESDRRRYPATDLDSANHAEQASQTLTLLLGLVLVQT